MPDSLPDSSAALVPCPSSRVKTPTLGIAGGGQLARMTAMAAVQLGCRVVVLERTRHCPASAIAHQELTGDWNDLSDLRRLASHCDVLTVENEFVDERHLAELERDGVAVAPGSACLGAVQDKFRQKTLLASVGLPVPRFRAVSTAQEVLEGGREFGWPIVLKRRRNGYDGKGNRTVRRAEDLPGAWEELGGREGALYVEEFCHFTTEIAVMVVRSRKGDLANYPVVETRQQDHICHSVSAPASVPGEISSHAGELAGRAAQAVGMVGSMGVEMFVTSSGRIVINELAPRVHNSGHFTIEACHCSQFENHVRAVLGWPLGSTAMRAPAAAMVNLLGSGSGAGQPAGLERALAIPGAHVHVYGKAASQAGRKMGHVTALGDTPAEALERARQAARMIRFGHHPTTT